MAHISNVSQGLHKHLVSTFGKYEVIYIAIHCTILGLRYYEFFCIPEFAVYTLVVSLEEGCQWAIILQNTEYCLAFFIALRTNKVDIVDELTSESADSSR